MLEERLPDDVTNLRPRKLRLGRDVERLLEGLSGKEESLGRASQIRNLRPSAERINSIRCVGCRQIEYITRDYCRCGHYFAGQIEDEYLAWERDLVETHERLSAETERKLKPFRVAALAALPLIVWPILSPVLFDEFGSLTTRLWMLPGIAIFGLFGLIQALVTAKRDASTQAPETASFEQFLIERWSKS